MRPSGPVVVTGASSQLGVFLIPRLSSADFEVQAISRRAPGDPVEVAGRVRWADPDSGCGNARGLVSCGPIPLAVHTIEHCPDLEKAIVFSTSSVLTKRESPEQAEHRVVSAIAAEEEKLESLCGERGIDLVLLRPTLIYGCGLDRNISLLLRLGERTGFIPVSRRAGGMRQPVHADDLAALAVNALVTDTGRCLKSEAAGGSTLGYREMVQRTATCAGRRVRVLPLPGVLLSLLVRTAAVLGPWKDINAQMVHRQARDMVFDDTALRERLGWLPRPFNPTPDDFRVPPNLKPYRLPAKT